MPSKLVGMEGVQRSRTAHPQWPEVLRRYDMVRYQLSMRFRWARRTLRNLQPVEVTQGTLAVDKWLRLYLQPDYVLTLSRDQMLGAVWHEVNHLLRNHPGRLGHKEQHQLANVAADCEVNQDLRGQLTLPDGIMQPEDFGLTPGGTAEMYYGTLVDMIPPEQQGGQGQQGQGAGQDQGEGGGQGDGQDEGDQPSEGQGNSPSKFGGDCGSGGGGDAHPEEKQAPDQKEQSRLNREARGQAKDVVDEVNANGYSEVGRATYEAAIEVLGTTKVDWRKETAVEVRRAMEQVTDEAEEYTFKRRSRRQAALDDSGLLVPGSHRPIPDLRVVVDVSGSMDAAKLTAALREVRGVLERLAIPEFIAYAWSSHQEGEPVRVRTVADVQRIVSTHGGGTDMQSGVMHAKAEGAEVIVVMTDAECKWTWLDQHDEYAPLIICGINRRPNYQLPSYARVVDVTSDE